MQVNNPGNSLGLIEIRLNTIKLHQESQIHDLKASVRNLEAIRDHLLNELELKNKSSTNNISIDSDMNPYHPSLESASFKDEEKLESSTDAQEKDKYQATMETHSSKKAKKKKSESKRKSSKPLSGDGKYESEKRRKKRKHRSKDDKALESKKKKKEHKNSGEESKGIFSNWKQSKQT